MLEILDILNILKKTHILKNLTFLTKFNVKYLYAIIIVLLLISLYIIYSTFKVMFRWIPTLFILYFVYRFYRMTISESFTKPKKTPKKKQKGKRKRKSKRVNRTRK
jgi:hypothetical protein